MERSKITWTDISGGNANFVLRGKTPGECEVSPGCMNCYAADILQRGGESIKPLTTWSETKLKKICKCKPDGPFRRGAKSRPMIFVCDMGDIFHNTVPDGFILGAFEAMGERKDIDWQVLTKRPERMAALFAGLAIPNNIWCGCTCENQEMADLRLPFLRQVNARIRFVSVEPQLEPVILDLAGIHWVINGGESGNGRRPFDKAWARSLHDQCRAAGVAFFFKQGSGRYPGKDHLLDGVLEQTWPE